MENRDARENPSKYENIDFFDLKSDKKLMFRPKS